MADQAVTKDLPEVTVGWVDMLTAAMKDRQLTQKDLAVLVARRYGDEAGLTKAVQVAINRVIKHRQWTQYVDEIADCVEIQHPYVVVQHASEARWIEAGRRIFASNPAAHESLVAEVLRYAESLEKVREAHQDVTRIVTPPTSDDDDTT